VPLLDRIGSGNLAGKRTLRCDRPTSPASRSGLLAACAGDRRTSRARSRPSRCASSAEALGQGDVGSTTYVATGKTRSSTASLRRCQRDRPAGDRGTGRPRGCGNGAIGPSGLLRHPWAALGEFFLRLNTGPACSAPSMPPSDALVAAGFLPEAGRSTLERRRQPTFTASTLQEINFPIDRLRTTPAMGPPLSCPSFPSIVFAPLERAEPPGDRVPATTGFMPSASDLNSSLMGWSAPWPSSAAESCRLMLVVNDWLLRPSAHHHTSPSVTSTAGIKPMQEVGSSPTAVAADPRRARHITAPLSRLLAETPRGHCQLYWVITIQAVNSPAGRSGSASIASGSTTRAAVRRWRPRRAASTTSTKANANLEGCFATRSQTVPRWQSSGNQQHGQHTHGDPESTAPAQGHQPRPRRAAKPAPTTQAGHGTQLERNQHQVAQELGQMHHLREKANDTGCIKLSAAPEQQIQPTTRRKAAIAPMRPTGL